MAAPYLLFLLMSACTPIGNPRIEAHRGAAGYWPQNSALAMRESLDREWDIEFDLVLTADRVPVLSHDPWVHQELCTWRDGGVIEERILIRYLTADDLEANFRCGGEPDPDFPNAEVRPEAPMRLGALLLALKEHPEPTVHIDVKFVPGMTESADVFAEAILGLWLERDLPNPWYVSANLPEALEAFAEEGRLRGADVPMSLGLPFHPAVGGSQVGTALRTERQRLTGGGDYVDMALDAGATGISVNHELADRRLVRRAVDAGIAVQLWTINDPAALEQYARWPVDALITDFPHDAP